MDDNKLAKRNRLLRWVTLTFAGVVGTLTGSFVEQMPLGKALLISALAGLAAGGLLFVIIKVVTRRTSS